MANATLYKSNTNMTLAPPTPSFLSFQSPHSTEGSKGSAQFEGAMMLNFWGFFYSKTQVTHN